jgi:hypothetical protein
VFESDSVSGRGDPMISLTSRKTVEREAGVFVEDLQEDNLDVARKGWSWEEALVDFVYRVESS